MKVTPITQAKAGRSDKGKEASTRRSVHEILEGVLKNAREELGRSTLALAFSGVAGGLTMGLTGLGVAIARAHLGLGSMQQLVAMLLYPVGFVAVVIGRAQLFTENTLYPVVLVLDERKHVLNTMRLWGTVFAANVAGALVFALLAARSGALRPDYVHALVEIGRDASSGPAAHVFWSGVIGGWLIALVAWMVTASHWTIGQLMVTYMLTYLVGVGHFSHCIASSGEILSAVVSGALPANAYLRWLVPCTLGNILGGTVMVSLLNYGQVTAGEG
ncbi:MAG: formate/nitrite transporter family protein [Acidobacteria bacterium]|nr:formate/nitrite transporter family protein [Acidobacteriota bacterium]